MLIILLRHQNSKVKLKNQNNATPLCPGCLKVLESKNDFEEKCIIVSNMSSYFSP